MQQGIGNAPLLMSNLKRDGLVVEAQDLPATLLLVAIDKADDIAGDLNQKISGKPKAEEPPAPTPPPTTPPADPTAPKA